MKRFSILFLMINVSLLSYSQSSIEEGDKCFEKADYFCAITNYENVFKDATGKEKQLVQIKLTRSNWCSEHLKLANEAYNKKKYYIAKDEYQKVLDSNPDDIYAQNQITKCETALNPPKLRKASASDIADIWNNKYGIQPERRQNLINAGIDPDDAQTRINSGEGKPLEKGKLVTNLSVSNSILYFSSEGGTSEQIKVYSNASSYSVPLNFIPSWCTVLTYNGYFTVTVIANPNYKVRKDWFKIIAGDKEVRIYVEQSAKTSSTSQEISNSNKQTNQSNKKECFNCPKTSDSWGLSLGYTQQTIENISMEAFQIGLKFEPLFKSGFGLNTGINLLGYSEDLANTMSLKRDFEAYAVNIPLHIEYRMNLSKEFNPFIYGGVGLNVLTNTEFIDFSLPITLEYGGGIKVSHIQFNIGKSLYYGNLQNTDNFGNNIETYQKLNFSISYMF